MLVNPNQGKVSIFHPGLVFPGKVHISCFTLHIMPNVLFILHNIRKNISNIYRLFFLPKCSKDKVKHLFFLYRKSAKCTTENPPFLETCTLHNRPPLPQPICESV